MFAGPVSKRKLAVASGARKNGDVGDAAEVE